MTTATASSTGSSLAHAAGVELGFATVVGLPGVAFEKDGVYYDSGLNQVSPSADVEFVVVRSGRTGKERLVTLAELATLLGV